MEILLTITSGQKILVMWDLLVVNRTRQSLVFCFKGALLKYYDDVNLFGFDCDGGSKVREKDGEWEDSQVQVS